MEAHDTSNVGFVMRHDKQQQSYDVRESFSPDLALLQRLHESQATTQNNDGMTSARFNNYQETEEESSRRINRNRRTKPRALEASDFSDARGPTSSSSNLNSQRNFMNSHRTNQSGLSSRGGNSIQDSASREMLSGTVVKDKDNERVEVEDISDRCNNNQNNNHHGMMFNAGQVQAAQSDYLSNIEEVSERSHTKRQHSYGSSYQLQQLDGGDHYRNPTASPSMNENFQFRVRDQPEFQLLTQSEQYQRHDYSLDGSTRSRKLVSQPSLRQLNWEGIPQQSYQQTTGIADRKHSAHRAESEEHIAASNRYTSDQSQQLQYLYQQQLQFQPSNQEEASWRQQQQQQHQLVIQQEQLLNISNHNFIDFQEDKYINQQYPKYVNQQDPQAYETANIDFIRQRSLSKSQNQQPQEYNKSPLREYNQRLSNNNIALRELKGDKQLKNQEKLTGNIRDEYDQDSDKENVDSHQLAIKPQLSRNNNTQNINQQGKPRIKKLTSSLDRSSSLKTSNSFKPQVLDQTEYEQIFQLLLHERDKNASLEQDLNKKTQEKQLMEENITQKSIKHEEDTRTLTGKLQDAERHIEYLQQELEQINGITRQLEKEKVLLVEQNTQLLVQIKNNSKNRTNNSSDGQTFQTEDEPATANNLSSSAYSQNFKNKNQQAHGGQPKNNITTNSSNSSYSNKVSSQNTNTCFSSSITDDNKNRRKDSCSEMQQQSLLDISYTKQPVHPNNNNTHPAETTQFVSCVLSMIEQCAPIGTFTENHPNNLKRSWKILKQIMQNYISLKKTAEKHTKNVEVVYSVARVLGLDNIEMLPDTLKRLISRQNQLEEESKGKNEKMKRMQETLNQIQQTQKSQKNGSLREGSLNGNGNGYPKGILQQELQKSWLDDIQNNNDNNLNNQSNIENCNIDLRNSQDGNFTFKSMNVNQYRDSSIGVKPAVAQVPILAGSISSKSNPKKTRNNSCSYFISSDQRDDESYTNSKMDQSLRSIKQQSDQQQPLPSPNNNYNSNNIGHSRKISNQQVAHARSDSFDYSLINALNQTAKQNDIKTPHDLPKPTGQLSLNNSNSQIKPPFQNQSGRISESSTLKQSSQHELAGSLKQQQQQPQKQHQKLWSYSLAEMSNSLHRRRSSAASISPQARIQNQQQNTQI